MSRLLKRQVKVLEGSGLKPGVGSYSEDEDAAIKRAEDGRRGMIIDGRQLL